MRGAATPLGLFECIHLFNCGHLLGQSLAKSLAGWHTMASKFGRHINSFVWRWLSSSSLSSSLLICISQILWRHPGNRAQDSRILSDTVCQMDAALSGALKLEFGIVGTMWGAGIEGRRACVLCNWHSLLCLAFKRYKSCLSARSVMILRRCHSCCSCCYCYCCCWWLRIIGSHACQENASDPQPSGCRLPLPPPLPTQC